MSRGGGGGNSQMENQEIDQRLQKITLGKIPIPDKNIDCQTLLRQDVSHQGWLRRKKPGKLTTVLGSLLPSIMWEQMYVVINKGCLYFYNNEYEKKPNKAVSLFGYTRVMRAGELQMKQAGGVWPFKVAYVLDEHDRVHYLSAACEEDMMKWLKFIKLELYRANGVEYEDSNIDEDIHDLETPISTGNYFSRIQGLKEIKEVVEDDSDMDSDYDYIETDEAVKNSKSKFSDSASVSSNESKSSNRYPVVPPSLKPGKSAPPPTPPRPDAKASTQSPGYYPVSIVNHDSPPSGAGGKPQSSAKKGPPTPPTKPLPKPQPAVLPKQKLQKFGSVSVGGGDSPPVRTPSGESLPFVSAADLQKALNTSKVTAPVKPVPAKPSKSAMHAAMPPDHSELGETKSSSAATGKPLPPIPSQERGSRAPTAVVLPMRNPAVTQRKQYTQDLEASALWAEDAGEGQRLLMNLGVEGAYMLRCCLGGAQGRTLLVIAEYQLRKYKIFTNEVGMFSLQTDFQPSFDSVHNLLNFYRTNFLPNRCTTLSQSYKELQRR